MGGGWDGEKPLGPRRWKNGPRRDGIWSPVGCEETEAAGVSILACIISARAEQVAILRSPDLVFFLTETKGSWVWISFGCFKHISIRDFTLLVEIGGGNFFAPLPISFPFNYATRIVLGQALRVPFQAREFSIY